MIAIIRSVLSGFKINHKPYYKYFRLVSKFDAAYTQHNTKCLLDLRQIRQIVCKNYRTIKISVAKNYMLNLNLMLAYGEYC